MYCLISYTNYLEVISKIVQTIIRSSANRVSLPVPSRRILTEVFATFQMSASTLNLVYRRCVLSYAYGVSNIGNALPTVFDFPVHFQCYAYSFFSSSRIRQTVLISAHRIYRRNIVSLILSILIAFIKKHNYFIDVLSLRDCIL